MANFVSNFDGQNYGLFDAIPAGDYKVSDAGVQTASWDSNRGQLVIALKSGSSEVGVIPVNNLFRRRITKDKGIIDPRTLPNNDFTAKMREVLVGKTTLGEAREALKTLAGSKVTLAYVNDTFTSRDGNLYAGSIPTLAIKA